MTDPEKHLTVLVELERLDDGTSWKVPESGLSLQTLTLGEVQIERRRWQSGELNIRWIAEDAPPPGNARLEVRVRQPTKPKRAHMAWLAENGGLAALAALIVAISGGGGIGGCWQKQKIDQLADDLAASNEEIENAKSVLLDTKRCAPTTGGELPEVAKSCAESINKIAEDHATLQKSFDILKRLHEQSKAVKNDVTDL
jgi:uncharacterized protein HemX